MYHTEVSYVNVMWILATFVIPDQTILLISSFVMVPILSWEFVLIYCTRIPIVKDMWFFTTFGKNFAPEKWDMRQTVLE
jgi:hypothetical protein